MSIIDSDTPTQHQTTRAQSDVRAHQNATGCNVATDFIQDPRTPLRRVMPGPGLLRADQESPEEPFHCDSELAGRPVKLPELSDRQCRAIELLVQGYTESAVAAEVGIHRTTIWRWGEHHPVFRAELARRRQELWSAAADRFRRTLFAAVKTLRNHLRHEQAAVQFRAAKALLMLAAHNRFAPPNEPTDPDQILNQFAHKRRGEIHQPDCLKDPISDTERYSALATLLAKAERVCQIFGGSEIMHFSGGVR
jgi:hypothetical protein